MLIKYRIISFHIASVLLFINGDSRMILTKGAITRFFSRDFWRAPLFQLGHSSSSSAFHPGIHITFPIRTFSLSSANSICFLLHIPCSSQSLFSISSFTWPQCWWRFIQFIHTIAIYSSRSNWQCKMPVFLGTRNKRFDAIANNTPMKK